MTPMRILMFSTDRALLDADSPVRARLVEQSGLVSELHIVLFSTGTAGGEVIHPTKHLFIHPTHSSRKFSVLADAYRVGREILSAGRADGAWVVSAQDPFETGVIAYLLARKFSLALHLQLHTDMWSPWWRKDSWKNRLRYPLGLFLIRRADALRVVSRRLRDGAIRSGVPERKVATVPIFTDTEHFRIGKPSFDLHEHYPEFGSIVVSLGRLEREKNYHGLIRAFAQVVRAHEDALLLLVGSGSERERLLALASSLGLSKAVKIVPWARDTLSYYKTADVYVQPSRYEGWGLAVAEAATTGAAIVMTDVGCARELIVNGQSGIVVPVGDERSLTAAILRVLDDETLRAGLRKEAALAARALATKAETLALYRTSWTHAHEEHKKRTGRP